MLTIWFSKKTLFVFYFLNILLNKSRCFLCTQTHTVNTQIIILSITPCQLRIIFVISLTALICMFYEILGIRKRNMLFLLNCIHTLIKTSFQEERYQILAFSENIITTSSNDDTVLISYHCSKSMQWLFRQVSSILSKRRNGKEQLIDRTFIKKRFHLVKHTSFVSHSVFYPCR